MIHYCLRKMTGIAQVHNVEYVQHGSSVVSSRDKVRRLTASMQIRFVETESGTSYGWSYSMVYMTLEQIDTFAKENIYWRLQRTV